MPSSYNPPSSGGGSPQVPAWTYTADAIGDGLFTTDNANIGGTASIILSKSVAGAWSEGRGIVPVDGTKLLVVNNQGLVSAFLVTGSFDASDNIQFTVTALRTGENTWSGQYTFVFVPQLQASAVQSDGGSISMTVGVSSAIGTAISDAIAGNNAAPTTLPVLMTSASITPAADNTYAVPTSITIKNGIITAIS